MKPIIFTSNHVVKILEQLKTATCRLRGLDYYNTDPDSVVSITQHIDWEVLTKRGNRMTIECPYAVGDILWVKEPYFLDKYEGDGDPLVRYKVEYYPKYHSWGTSTVDGDWRTPLFMPAAYSRIQLQVVSVRCQRLHSLTPEQLEQEGYGYAAPAKRHEVFASAWDEINSHKIPYATNPWVWFIEFSMIKAPATPAPQLVEL